MGDDRPGGATALTTRTAMTALPVLQQIDQAFASGPSVPCRAGCTACCHGPFDISPADARTASQGVAQLPPERRAPLLARAQSQLAAYADAMPDWTAPHDVAQLAEATFDELCDRFAQLPCPALEADGRCAIYEHRPATCRLTGRGWVDPPDGSTLENTCPIQDRFPGYRDMQATPIDLGAIEDQLEAADVAAMAAGWVSTTVAGAVVGGDGRAG